MFLTWQKVQNSSGEAGNGSHIGCWTELVQWRSAGACHRRRACTQTPSQWVYWLAMWRPRTHSETGVLSRLMTVPEPLPNWVLLFCVDPPQSVRLALGQLQWDRESSPWSNGSRRTALWKSVCDALVWKLNGDNPLRIWMLKFPVNKQDKYELQRTRSLVSCRKAGWRWVSMKPGFEALDKDEPPRAQYSSSWSERWMKCTRTKKRLAVDDSILL